MKKDKRISFNRKFSLVRPKGKKWRKRMGALLAAVLVCGMLPFGSVAASESVGSGLCEHHTEHTAECGYTEAQPCTHEHGEECYKTVTECVHTHTDECYSETEETDESAGEGNVITSDTESREPVNCTHVCQPSETGLEESGCITKVLDCHHEHDESCGYVEAQECGYVCEICNSTEPVNTENGIKNDIENDIEDNIENSMENDTQGVGGGETESKKMKDTDANLCAHHKEHTEECGYLGEDNTPCGYKCRICPIEGLIAALPDKVTEDNEDKVRAQLDEILALYRELTEEEQEQIDISRCLKLQEAIDAANAPALTQNFVTDRLDFTNVGSGNGQTPAEGPGYKWSGNVGSGYLLELENFRMELPENTNTAGNGQIAIAFPNKGQTTILVKGENRITAPGWNAIMAKVTNFSSGPYVDEDSILIKGEGESAALIIEDARTAIRATYALEIRNVEMRIGVDRHGIRTYHGDINLNNVTIQMELKNGDSACINTFMGNMIIQNSKIKLESAGFPPIYVRDGNLTVKDSKLDLSSDYHSGIYIASDTPGRSNIFSGATEVLVSCTSSYGIYSKGDLVIEAPAELTAAGGTVALAVFEGIVLRGTAVINPVDGVITPPGGGSNVYTVRAGNVAAVLATIKPVELMVSLDNTKYSYGSAAKAIVTADVGITGKVSLYQGETLLGTADLGEAISIDTGELGGGSHTLTAKLQEDKGDISKEFTLTVMKTVPTVTGPTASALQYGQKLSESLLSGGTAINPETGERVEGTWAWKDGNILPPVENDGYFAVFTPMDANKYDVVEVKVALTVNKAQNTPNMPDSTMEIEGGHETRDPSYTGEGEKEPSYMESIHQHFYTESVSRQPTYTDNGVQTYTDSGSDSNNAAIAALGHQYFDSVTKQPFIKDAEGKIGWDVIRAEEEKAEEGSVINVDMNGATVVPGDIFDSIRGRDIVITFDMGNGIIWSVNGMSVIVDKTNDIDFSVKTGINAIPVDIVNNVTGECYSIQLSLAYEGEFGFAAMLSMDLGKENGGYTASLYYYNEGTGELAFICSNKIAEDGTVSLTFTHASDYVIAIDGGEEEESDNVTEPAQPQATAGEDENIGDNAAGAAENPDAGRSGRFWRIIAAILLAAAVGTGVVFTVKRKGKGENSGQ